MNPKDYTGLDLSDSELDEATRRLAFFAPNKSKNYVDELFEFLALNSLASLPPGKRTPVEVYIKLKSLIGLQIEYEEFLGGLNRLTQQGIISCTTNSVFYTEAKLILEHETREEIIKSSRKQNTNERTVISNWKEEINSLYPNDITHEELSLLESDLREFVYRIVSYSSVESVLLYYSGEAELNELADHLSSSSIDEILPNRGTKLNQIRNEVLPKFFRTKNRSRKLFIDGLLQSTFILHMIQLDPKCSAIVQSEVLGGALYIDTNFLFRLFGLHTPEMFYASRYLVDLSKKLNYSLFVTQRTIEEYMYALNENLNNLRSAPSLPSDLVDAIIDYGQGEDPIVAYYRKIKELNKKGKSQVHISPEVYYEYYSEIETLLEESGIEINNELCEEINNHPEEIDLEANRLKSFFDDRRINHKHGYHNELNIHVAEHDAFHRLLILRARAGYDGTGFYDVPYWFLTCDTKLPAYDRVRRYHEKIKTPFCILTSQWLQTIRPFAPRIDPASYVDSISSPLLRGYEPIPNSVLIEVASRVKMYKNYNPSIGKIAMKRQFLLQFASTETEEEKQELIESVLVEYAQDMERIKQNAVEEKEKSQIINEQMENDIKGLKNKIKEIQETHQEKEKIHRKEINNLEEALSNKAEIIRNTEQELSKSKDRFQDLQEQSDLIDKNFQKLEAINEKVLSQNKRLIRYFISFTPLIIAVILLAYFQPWTTGGFTWLLLPILFSISYLIIQIIIHPFSSGKFGKLFTVLFPIIILLSIPKGFIDTQSIFIVIGIIADIFGLFGLVTYLLINNDRKY